MHGEGLDHRLEGRAAVLEGCLRAAEHDEGLAENAPVAGIDKPFHPYRGVFHGGDQVDLESEQGLGLESGRGRLVVPAGGGHVLAGHVVVVARDVAVALESIRGRS